MLDAATPYVSTTNACKLCTPLGACIAFKGLEGCMPILHGSQGCATYMRRYIISHFREPVDIASSALGEDQAIYGGGPNLMQGIINVMDKYNPDIIGIASTCLTETIGDDVPMILSGFKKEFAHLKIPELIHVSTPSYSGTHMEGFHRAIRQTAIQMAEPDPLPHSKITVLPGFVSPWDVRHLKGVMRDFDIPGIILPDISETLEGTIQEDIEMVPSGGTSMQDLKSLGGSPACIELGNCIKNDLSTAGWLEKNLNVPAHRLGLPIGLRGMDAFMQTLSRISGKDMPREQMLERGRLVDAYVDAHKYLFGKKCLIYGEEDLVTGLVSFLAETGVQPVLAASGGRSGLMQKSIEQACDGMLPQTPSVLSGVDFYQIVEEAEKLEPDFILGNSKAYRIAAGKWDIPLIRVGFPVHDRMGAGRIRHAGYEGAYDLLMRIVNTLLEKRQEDADLGWGYM
ncbi:Nitrogenase [Desulfonatronospira thiodismutans ASO3-1]|uniref:Nitrogenase n=1 Tax=Desulfonatronospira thiodismutans ASO3-1 TaxID=555779 RepID=D6SLD8_9BACT|nr:nitrogenase component 1 [Desulfonatronospira thiodismutans]EFI35499.1 Nitrogenase [Desulfonatronospira thiodismutans ASO3-1]